MIISHCSDILVGSREHIALHYETYLHRSLLLVKNRLLLPEDDDARFELNKLNSSIWSKSVVVLTRFGDLLQHKLGSVVVDEGDSALWFPGGIGLFIMEICLFLDSGQNSAFWMMKKMNINAKHTKTFYQWWHTINITSGTVGIHVGQINLAFDSSSDGFLRPVLNVQSCWVKCTWLNCDELIIFAKTYLLIRAFYMVFLVFVHFAVGWTRKTGPWT